MLIRRDLIFVLFCIVGFCNSQISVWAQEANDELVELIVSFLRDPDKDVRALAFEQVRTEAQGKAATEKFTSLLSSLESDAQIGLLRALADRGDQNARPGIKTLLHAKDLDVRVAAIRALGYLGAAEDRESLVRLLDKGAEEKKAARDALIRLNTDGIIHALANQLQREPPKTRVALIEILTVRRAKDAIPQITNMTVNAEESVRRAAMTSLGEIADPQTHIGGMVRGVLRATPGSERLAAEKAVMFALRRIADRDERARPLLREMARLSYSEFTAMLSTLGRVGGLPALHVADAAINSRIESRHEAGIFALANWPDASIAPKLIQLAESDAHPKHRSMALRALIRVAPLNDERTPNDRLELLQTAWKMCKRDSDRNFVLQRASAIRIPETLRFVLPYVDQAKFSKQACQTIVELAHHRNLREPNEDEFHQALDRVIAVSKDAVVIDRANRYKTDRTWVRPK